MNADEMIALAAVFIALVALGVGIWGGVMSRQHNRLSVMPLLIIRHHLGGSLDRFGLAISNEGLGPAIVKQCVLQVDHEPIAEDRSNGWKTAIDVLGLRKLEPKPRYETIAPDGAIRPGDTKWLLSTVEKGHIGQFESAFRRLKVRVSYESGYGEKKETTWGPLIIEPDDGGPATQPSGKDDTGRSSPKGSRHYP